MTSAAKLNFEVAGQSGVESRTLTLHHAVVAGWSGRDEEALNAHIEEMAELGIPGPSEVPMFYRVSAAHLTTADEIQVVGGDSSGEVEYVVIADGGELFIGAASEHTDRRVEQHGITIAKQLCEKPLASTLWRYADVADHWDDLILRAWAVDADGRTLYQEGRLAEMRHVEELIERYGGGQGLADGTLMFGGTLAAIGGIRSAARFEFELEDPVLGRNMFHGYDIVVLPING